MSLLKSILLKNTRATVTLEVFRKLMESNLHLHSSTERLLVSSSHRKDLVVDETTRSRGSPISLHTRTFTTTSIRCLCLMGDNKTEQSIMTLVGDKSATDQRVSLSRNTVKLYLPMWRGPRGVGRRRMCCRSHDWIVRGISHHLLQSFLLQLSHTEDTSRE